MLFFRKLLEKLPYLVIFLLFFLAPIDSDLGWHLRYGDYMLENFRLFYPNQLTYFLPDYTWENSYTLYQIITSFLFRSGEFLSLVFFYSLLGVSCFYFFNKFSPKTPLLNFFLFFLAIYFGWNVFSLGWRAQVFSFLFLILTYLAVHKAPDKPMLLKYLPLLFPFWTNLHGAFTLGILVLFLAFIDSISRKDKRLAKHFGVTLALSTIATLVNPYGFGVWEETIKHLRFAPGNVIIEWLPPDFWQQVTIILLTVPVLVIVFKKSKNPFFWMASIAFLVYSAYTARRNLPFWSLTIVIPLLIIYRDKLVFLEKHLLLRPLYMISIAGAIFYLVVISVPKAIDISTNWNNYCDKGLRPYPCQAINYLQNLNVPGPNVFSTYEWGGLLEWHLPKYKYFLDGRTHLWENSENRSPYLIHSDILKTQGDFLKKLEDYETDILLIPSYSALNSYLANNPSNWKKIYSDRVAVIYTQK